MLPGHRLSSFDAPLSQIQDDPEGLCLIQLSSSGPAYLFVSDYPMRRDLGHLAKSAYDVADSPGTLCQSILAGCCALYCKVFMATSQFQQAEQGTVLAHVVSRVSNFY
jgi:hypothetical protein